MTLTPGDFISELEISYDVNRFGLYYAAIKTDFGMTINSG